jgi:hypothetical protein
MEWTRRCVWDSLVQCTPYMYEYFLPLITSLSDSVDCPATTDVTPQPPFPASNMTLPSCGQDKVKVCAVKFIG